VRQPCQRRQHLSASHSAACRRSLLAVLDTDSCLSEVEKLRLYSADERCDGTCKRSRLTTCFCGLKPASTSSREGSLWSRAPKAAAALASEELRTVRLPQRMVRHSHTTVANLQDNEPVGLNNLGATCYDNAVLQVLFCNVTFRDRVFRLEPSVLAESSVLRLLRCASPLHRLAVCLTQKHQRALRTDAGWQRQQR